MAYSSKDAAWFECALNLKDSFFLNFAVLIAYLLVLNREGFSVPSNTEVHYLLHLAKRWDPNLLPDDWTLSGLPTRLVFDIVFGPLTLLFPLEVVGWIGRFVSWSLTIVALFQLGKHFRISLWMITVSILLWLFHGQSVVGGEYVVGTFEPKSISYALVLFALNGFIRQRRTLPPILLGLGVSFHPLVGLWSGLAVGLSLLVVRYPLDAIIRFGCYTVLFALPGLVPLLMPPSELGPESLEAQRFVSLVVMPYHFDPFYFGRDGKLLLLLAILLAFNCIHFSSDRKSHALRFLMSFQAFLGLFFVSGFLVRYVENYQLLLLMPCRLFPVLLPLFFFFHLMSLLEHCRSIRYGNGLVVIGLLALASFGNPIDVFIRNVRYQYSTWTRGEDDIRTVFKWIAKNTPRNAIVISPPWRGDSFYYSRRGQIADWWTPRFDRLTEWRGRLESLVGDISGLRPGTAIARIEQMTARYNALTATELVSITERYGAEYLVSSAAYDYPVLFSSGRYNVYSFGRGGPHPEEKNKEFRGEKFLPSE